MADVCHFADYAERPDLTLALILGRLNSPEDTELELFPVRLGHTKVRDFASPHPVDDIIYRIVGGRVSGSIERRLDSSVVSWRLTKQPPAWRLWGKKKSFDLQGKKVRAFSDFDPFPGALVTDVSNYFPSIDPEILSRQLSSLSAPREAVSYLESQITRWQDAGLSGIPIGPETSALLGNAFLSPLDAELARSGFKYVRLTDDLVILPADSGIGLEPIIVLVDQALDQIGLKRSAAKTERHYSAHSLLVSLDQIADSYFSRPVFAMTDVEAASEFEEHLAEVPVPLKRLKQLLGFFRSKRSTYPLRLLEGRPDILKLAPEACGRYVAALAEVDQSHLVPFLALIRRDPRQSFDSFLLHLLKAARMYAWPLVEGQQFSELALSTKAPLIRAEALMAWSKTSLWSRDEALHLAKDDRSFRVRRAAVLTFRYVDPNRAYTKHLLEPVALGEPALKPAVEYVMG